MRTVEGIVLQVPTIRKLLAGRIALHQVGNELPATVGQLLRVREPWRRNVDGSFRYVADYASLDERIGGLAQHQIFWQAPTVMPAEAIRLTVAVRSARRLPDRGWCMTLEPVPNDQLSAEIRTATFHDSSERVSNDEHGNAALRGLGHRRALRP